MFEFITPFFFNSKNTLFSKSFKLYIINHFSQHLRETCPLRINRFWAFPKILLDK